MGCNLIYNFYLCKHLGLGFHFFSCPGPCNHQGWACLWVLAPKYVILTGPLLSCWPPDSPFLIQQLQELKMQTLVYCLRPTSGSFAKTLIRTFQLCLLHTSPHPTLPSSPHPKLPNSGRCDLPSSLLLNTPASSHLGLLRFCSLSLELFSLSPLLGCPFLAIRTLLKCHFLTLSTLSSNHSLSLCHFIFFFYYLLYLFTYFLVPYWKRGPHLSCSPFHRWLWEPYLAYRQ